MKYAIHTSSQNGRPLHVLFDQNENVELVSLKFSLYLNFNLRYSPNSLLSYVREVACLVEFLSAFGFLREVKSMGEYLLHVRSYHVMQYLLGMKNRELSDFTIHSADARLRSFFKWLYSFKSGYNLNLKDNPYADGEYKSPKPYRNSVKFVTYIEVVGFLKKFKHEREKVLGHFLFDTGVRVSELCRVCVSDLPNPRNFPDNVIFYPMLIRGSKGRGGNTKDRQIIVSGIVVDRLWSYFNNYVKPNFDFSKYEKGRVPLFLNSFNRPIKHKTITDLFYRKSQEEKENSISAKSITPHMFRHGAAISIMASDLGKDFLENMVIVQKQLGHSRLSSTEVYANIPIDALRRLKGINSEKKGLSRSQEAEYIFKHTY
jgi:integrase/recombinase XerD